ncbi:MAG: DNA-protecting protein DprA [Alphaproteobacteria bacterium]|nr:DNA-protecting protein DprA [Alphaproteobacteria bacterium]
MSQPQTAALSESERLDRLRLIRSQNVGPVTFRQLIERFGSGSAALEALPNLARRGGRRGGLKICSAAAARQEFEQMRALGGRHMVIGDPDFPIALAAISDAPPTLCLLGDSTLLNRRIIAVVGARNASTNGRRFAEHLSRDLGRADLVIGSGLARGADAAAHTGALATGTIAVVAGGADVIYPRENTDLYEQICEHGLVVSEQPPGVEPLARHFPRRNRIISGLALGVVVIEAAARSGSLITARLAGEQGREVFAVPGSPLDPRAKGPNKLIRDGAILLESAADVLDALPPLGQGEFSEFKTGGYQPPLTRQDGAKPTEGPDLENARDAILEHLGPAPTRLDDLIRGSDYPINIWSLILLELELAGRLERHPGGAVSLLASLSDV